MEYYDPNDHTSKRYALVVTIMVLVLCAVMVGLVEVDVHPAREASVRLVVEVVEEQQPEVKKPPTERRTQPSVQEVRHDMAPAHVEEAPVEQSQQSGGEAEQTTTINPDALFKPVVGTSAEQVAVGNRLAPEDDKEQMSGEGEGYNLMGDATLDTGLQARGLREALGRPTVKSNASGTVVVRIEVDSEGNVVEDTVEVIQDGTTTNDRELREAAIKEAKRAKFNPSSRMAQGGTITYVFNKN